MGVFLNDLLFPKYRRSYTDSIFTGCCAGHILHAYTRDKFAEKSLISQTSEQTEIQEEVRWMFACHIWGSDTSTLLYYSYANYPEITFNPVNYTAVQL